MPQGATLQVEGYEGLMRAFAAAEREQRLAGRKVLRGVGEVVERAAARSVAPVHARSAGGFKTRVRLRGVAVEQSLRRTTGVHPEWGSWQMRHALVPALEANEAETVRAMERAMDQVADHFNRGGLL